MDHHARRRRLLTRLDDLGIDALLVTHLPNVRYLTGFTGSNGQLLIAANHAVFLTDPRYEEQARHEAPDVERATYRLDFPSSFAEISGDLGLARVGFEAASVSYGLYERLRRTGVELVPTTGEVERLRRVKDPDELALIEEAQRATDDALERVLPKLVEGRNEREVALDLEHEMRALGAEEAAFRSIVAFGESAAEPHHVPGERTLRRGDIIKLDFGARVQGYCADMTRTVALGAPSRDLVEIHDLVRRAQAEGIEAVRPGAVGGEVDRVAREVIAHAGQRERFGHSLGHGIGLEVHEAPTLRRGSEDVLEPGTVVTVEPGVYIPGVGGVRIEDMVVVTETGARPLPSAPRELQIL
ncbi:MAG TPA: Xaa-Pro peptidase family protein [Actinomycetota bacterium]|nr:Xaa-Pro peptidase family protein [Actinomycetota bacterium]